MSYIEDILSEKFGINKKIAELVQETESMLAERFREQDEIKEANQYKVTDAFRKNRISDTHFAWNTGYGYDDAGRAALESVYADTFGAEAALVRTNIVNGTHALSIAIMGCLRPGDEMIYCSGGPYDTLEEVIGIRGEGMGSLKEFGVTYKQVELKADGSIDIDADCYGEFIDVKEPTQVGVDIMAGSLIKNPGGGLALSGGYVVGRKDLVDMVQYRMTCPGIGGECGLMFGQTRAMLQGFFMAPSVVNGAVKGAILCGEVYHRLGYDVRPEKDDKRSDIIQSVKLGSPEAVCAFCEGIQKAAPVDSFVTPVPSDMPGYEDQVVMAAGAFVQGSSIELSSDAPIRAPYIVYFQGGLTYEHSKLGVLMSLQRLYEKGLLKNIDETM